MNTVEYIVKNKLNEAKASIQIRLKELVFERLLEAKKYIVEEMLDEATPNIIKQGRIQRIRRRIRRNKAGRIVLQRNRKKSSLKGYRIAKPGSNRIVRIPATVRIRKARLLKRSWKTTRRAKLRRTLLKRKMSMRRRSAMGIR